MKILNAKVSSFKEALASKENELADLMGSHLAEVDSLKEQGSNLQSSTDALKNAKEESYKAAKDKSAEVERLKENDNSTISQLGETHTAEVSKLKEEYAAAISKLRDDHASVISKLCEDHIAEISSLQEKHEFALVDERTHGYNEVIAEASDDVGVLNDNIYKGGY